VSPPTTTGPMRAWHPLPRAVASNVAGLALTAGGMLLQIAGGSTLYPSLTGPIVLALTALAVAFVRGRWVAYLGLGVPLVLGVGAIAAAAMTGGFIDQLTDPSELGVFLGSILHVLGLTLAVVGGLGMVLRRGVGATDGR
jgi:hypothetical protein